MKGIVHFFDKLEDHVRGWMSHRQIFYGFVGGVGIVLFWRGVWHTADYLFTLWLPHQDMLASTTDRAALWDGLASIVIGSVLLLMTGLFVSSFIGNEIIISGLRGEKKVAEKTEEEVKGEVGAVETVKREIKEVEKRLERIEKKV